MTQPKNQGPKVTFTYSLHEDREEIRAHFTGRTAIAYMDDIANEIRRWSKYAADPVDVLESLHNLLREYAADKDSF